MLRVQRNADLPDNPVPLVREIWSGTALIPQAMTQPDPAFVIAHFEARDVSMILAALDTSAITQLMFDLCSAPCKARRFAPPAHTPTPTRTRRASVAPGRAACGP